MPIAAFALSCCREDLQQLLLGTGRDCMHEGTSFIAGAVQVPEDPAVVIEELQKAKLPAAARKVARKRVTLPPKERKRSRRTVNMATATNQHMPELFTAPPPHQID